MVRCLYYCYNLLLAIEALSYYSNSDYIHDNRYWKVLFTYKMEITPILLKSSTQVEISTSPKDNLSKTLPCNSLYKQESKRSKSVESKIVPIVIRTAPIFISRDKYLNIWKNLIIDTNLASEYSIETKLTSIREDKAYSMVLSLSSLDEMQKYNICHYGSNVQKSGKTFIYFPLYKKSLCPHKYISKAVCYIKPCGIVTPFVDMKAMTTMINKYMDDKGVLLHCHQDYDRMFLFIGCCMIQGGIPLDEVLYIMKTLNIKMAYKMYIETFAHYLYEIN